MKSKWISVLVNFREIWSMCKFQTLSFSIIFFSNFRGIFRFLKFSLNLTPVSNKKSSDFWECDNFKQYIYFYKKNQISDGDIYRILKLTIVSNNQSPTFKEGENLKKFESFFRTKEFFKFPTEKVFKFDV